MYEWESLSHEGWDCKYHMVIVPKCGQEVVYGKFKRDHCEIICDLRCRRGVVFFEGR
jgi:REP element-mobilizing transposase RayT